MVPEKEKLIKEVTFKTSRSGGKGGQNVNKVSSKVELIFNIQQSGLFTEEQKTTIQAKIASRLDSEGNLHLVSQEDRSQLLNKQRVMIKLIALLTKAMHVQQKRKPTKIPKALIKKRLADKTANAAKKEYRKKPGLD